jgi:methionine synthase II (cobalamin-independent)
MFEPFTTTGIGSLPHHSVTDGCRLVLSSFDIPFWPQFPRISFKEFMIPQYAEGLPFLRMDTEKQTVWVDRNGSDELDRFYESCTVESRIAISEDHAQGLHALLRMIKGRRFAYLKGQVTGPLTFSLGLKDVSGKALYFDEEFREISLMLLQAKTRWQIDMLKQHAEKVVIFVDEPILSALGSSSYLGVSSEETLRLLREVAVTIKAEGGIAGIHCCGNADWPMVMQSGADIVNFDAYDYLDTLALYHEESRNFLEQGGFFAWGIVPTSDAITGENPDSLRDRFQQGVRKLSEHIPRDLLLSRMLLTPSCGTGSRSVDEAVKIFQLLIRMKEEMA